MLVTKKDGLLARPFTHIRIALFLISPSKATAPPSTVAAVTAAAA
jgi:hypothetical protein